MQIRNFIQATEEQLLLYKKVDDKLLHMSEEEFGKESRIIMYRVYPSQQGNVLMLLHEDHLFGMYFLVEALESKLELLQEKYPNITLQESSYVDNFWKAFCEKQTLSCLLVGSFFCFQVWKMLTRIPEGGLVSYEFIAKAISRPQAVRAVATAVGKNPIVWLIPCHRVVRKNGGLGGYYYGLERKKNLLKMEINPLHNIL